MGELPMLLESVVAVLLAVTLCYCVVLERRMRAFRNDQAALVQLIAELDSATGRAERAVLGLSATTREAEEGLEQKIGEARNLTRSLAMMARAGSRHAGAPARRQPQAANGAAS